jgi:hypothetical protein
MEECVEKDGAPKGDITYSDHSNDYLKIMECIIQGNFTTVIQMSKL